MRYHGTYSNAARGQRRRDGAADTPQPPPPAAPEPGPTALRKRRADLLRRLYEVDPLKKNPFRQNTSMPDAMNRLVFRIAIACVIVLAPFVINNFVQGRPLIGLVSTVIVTIFAFSAWSISRHKRYNHSLILLGLVPSILFFLFISFETQGIIAVLWSYAAVVFLYIILPERMAWLANAVLLIAVTLLAWNRFDHPLTYRIAATLLLVNILSALFVNVINAQQRSLEQQAITDPLTGLLNRMLLHDTLQQAINQSNRSNVPMTLLILDLDHFKQVNDERGHDVGDLALKGVANLLKKRLRQVDEVFRIGGEEFLALLYNAGLESGKQLAEEIRSQVESLETAPGCAITVSVGVATLQSDEAWQHWMKRGDINLYQAKEAGRNRVVA